LALLRTHKHRAILLTNGKSGYPHLGIVEALAGGEVELLFVNGRGDFWGVTLGADDATPLAGGVPTGPFGLENAFHLFL